MQLDELELIFDSETAREKKLHKLAARKKSIEVDGEDPSAQASKFGLKRKELRLFSSTLSRLLRGGVPLLRALETGQRASGREATRRILAALAQRIRQGESLSGALEAFPGTFPLYFSRMVKAGEISGTLDLIFERLARHLEKEEEIRRKIKEALAYPALVLVLGVATLFVLLHWVIPKMALVYEGFGNELPGITKVVLLVSRVSLPAFLILSVLSVLSFILFKKRKDLLFSMLLKFPVVGDMLKQNLLLQFSSMLALLLESAIPMLSALEMVKETSPNNIFRNDLDRVQASLSQGKRLSEAIEGLSWCPESATVLIHSGEESGKLPEALTEIAEDSSKELESRIQFLVKLLEPGLILTVGIVVGVIVISALLPILELDLLAR